MQKALEFMRQNSLALFSLLIAGFLVVWFLFNGAALQMRLSALRSANIVQPSPTASALLQPEIVGYPFQGSAEAPVVLVEYSDYQCPFCRQWQVNVWPQLKAQYVDTGKVKFVYKDFAFLGADSQTAAEASRCAAEQGKFWEYHDFLFENQGAENSGWAARENQKQFALRLGLDANQFNSCLESGKYSQLVQDSTQEGISLGVTGTPSSVVNGKLLVGALPFIQFQQVLDAELNN